MRKSFLSASLLASAIVIGSFGLSVAGGHLAYEQRQAAMKTVGKSAKTIGDMLKGQTEFDAAAANAALVAMRDAVQPYGDLFPEGSEHPESEAAPAIWSDRTGFDTVLAAFKEDLDAAVAAAPQDQAGMGAAFGAVAENCGTCHKGYRIKKN